MKDREREPVIWILLLLPPTFLVDGWILQQVWGWFVAATFRVQSLTLVQAIGLGIVMRFLTYQTQCRTQRDDADAFWSRLAQRYAYHIVLFVAAFIVHLFL